MAEHVPLSDSQGAAKRADVGGVVLDSRFGGIRRSGALTSTALIVENELAAGGERGKRRPEHVVPEQPTAIDRDERRPAGNRWCRENGERDPAGPDGLTIEPRCAGLGSPVAEEALVGRQVGGGEPAQALRCAQGKLSEGSAVSRPVSYTHLTLPTNREV